MHRRTLLRHSAVLVPAACGLTVPPASARVRWATRDGKAPIVIAHRGASGYLPEHTLAGYELALQMGADYIEPDLQLTRDGALVAMHDATLNRTTDVAERFAPRDGGYRVADFSLQEIRTLQVRPFGTARDSHPGFTPSTPGPHRVPAFDEVLVFARRASQATGRTVGLHIEAKQPTAAMEDAILAGLAAQGYGASDPVFLQSFEAEAIRNLRRKQDARGWRHRLVLLNSAPKALLALGLPQIARFADGVGVNIRGDGMGIDFVRQAHVAGLLVHGYTFGQSDPALAEPEYQQFLDMGLDGLFSNYPDLARAARER